MGIFMTNQNIINIADSIIKKSDYQNILLRLMGSVGVAYHCSSFLSFYRKTNRIINDIDFAGYFFQRECIYDILSQMGFNICSAIAALYSRKRLFMVHPDNGLHIDVYLNRLEYNHIIPWNKRLEVDYPTLPLAELLLSKLQIVQLNNRDVVDMLMLIREHPIGNIDKETINAQHIATLCAKDWGLWRTSTINIVKTIKQMQRYTWLTNQDRTIIQERINQLCKYISASSKSISWKMRNIPGTRIKWYRDVYEVSQ
jgi:hypothetical protein